MARRRNRKYHYMNYSSYRGASVGSRVLKVLVVALAVLLVALLAGYMILQRYMIYTDEGVRLNLPFSDQGRTDEGDPMDVQLETGDGAQAEGETGSETGTFRAVEVTADALAAGEAARLMEQAGADAVIVTLKDGSGAVQYASSVEDAAGLGGSHAVNDALQALDAAGVYVIARLDCFQDNEFPATHGGTALHTSDLYRWRDGENLRWVDPEGEQVQTYLCQLAAELAGLGVDEILLENACYPTTGQLQTIMNYETERPGFPDVIAAFYQKMSETLAGTGASLSVYATADALWGVDAVNGQSQTALAAFCRRVYVADDLSDGSGKSLAQLREALAAAGMAEADACILTPQGGDPLVWAEAAG